MKPLVAVAAAAAMALGLGLSQAKAEPYHHRHHHEHYRHGPQIWFGIGGPRVYHGPRHHYRRCWYEHRWRHHHRYTVRVCR